jgi:hypothetical protein
VRVTPHLFTSTTELDALVRALHALAAQDQRGGAERQEDGADPAVSAGVCVSRRTASSYHTTLKLVGQGTQPPKSG